MSVLNENQLMGASGAGGDYEIEQSLRFDDGRDTYLSRTPSVAGNRKTWTWSGWLKIGEVGTQKSLFLGGSDTSNKTFIRFVNDALYVQESTGGSTQWRNITTALFRDASAWYHIVINVDTTQSTDTNRVSVYINGTKITDFSTATYPTLNSDTYVNNTNTHYIGREFTSNLADLDGYLAEINFIDGQALTPDSFGETGDYGEWKPTKYAGTYGTNGFYLKFENASSLGNDSAGSNNWTPTNLAATDQMVDSPTNNFCTMNPLAVGGADVLSEGNLKFAGSATLRSYRPTTMGVSSGKFYFEGLVSSGTIASLGVCIEGGNLADSMGKDNFSWSYDSNGNTRHDLTSTAYGATYTTGDIIGAAFDVDAGTIIFYKNGVSQGSYSMPTFVADTYFLGVGDGTTASSNQWVANFGQDSSFAGNKTPQGNQDANGIGDFYYAPPTGFLALCTQNLPDATVIPSEHFNTVVYSGNGSTQSITGAGSPDFTWIKSRDRGTGSPYGGNHHLFDSIRGVGKTLYSNLTNEESAYQDNSLTSFDTDGFSVGDKAAVNYNGDDFVAWNWKAGGSASSNTNGTITSSVSANPSAGFSIVSWVGTNTTGSVGHSLSQIPELIISKSRTVVGDWIVPTTAIDGSTDYSRLNTTNAFATLGVTASTASVFYTAGGAGNRGDMIAYCFHSVDGYSKVGSYVGNGSTDGPFVHCGFRPAYVLIKDTTAVNPGHWQINDNTRSPSNVSDDALFANGSYAEADDDSRYEMDFLSNGIKIRTTDGNTNNSGNTYIFLAFAESPFKNSNAR